MHRKYSRQSALYAAVFQINCTFETCWSRIERWKMGGSGQQIKHPADKLCHGMLQGLSFALTRSFPSFTISFLCQPIDKPVAAYCYCSPAIARASAVMVFVTTLNPSGQKHTPASCSSNISTSRTACCFCLTLAQLAAASLKLKNIIQKSKSLSRTSIACAILYK